MTSILVDSTRPMGWLRGPGFDVNFIVGTAFLAIASGAIVIMLPRLFTPILLINLWLLGYHHVISTYTRLCFDWPSFHQHRFLILWLPFLVFGATLALAMGLGLWVLGSIYLYWQWFHYTRQSWGISQIYRRKSDGLEFEDKWLTAAMFYLLPLWGILHRSWQDPDRFLGVKVHVIPVPAVLVDVVAVAAIIALTLWAFFRIRTFLRGYRPVAHTIYVASHITLFSIGYLLIEDITHGWLVINIWHNAQYILFVWFYNTNRYRGGIDENSRLLSTISQVGNWWIYFALCLLTTTLIYTGVSSIGGQIFSLGLPSVMIIYMTINFHHYIVDSVIWKIRHAPMQKTLGLRPN